MGDFIEFVRMAARTPLLAAALLALAIKDNIQQRRKPQPVEWQDTVCQPVLEQQKAWTTPTTLAVMVGELKQNEEKYTAFLSWYQGRMEATSIIMAELPAKWLYAAHLINDPISQIVGEVKD